MEGIRSVDVARNPLYMDTPAGKIGVLAANALVADWDPAILIEQATQARKWCDILVVSLHWGAEYQAQPSPRQELLASQLLAGGADILWGHHPHVLQPMQWIKSSDETHETLVIYSLGNLYSDQFMLEDARRTALVKLEVRHAKIAAVEVYPLVLGMDTGRLVNADAGESEIILDRLKWMPSE